jgi:hypothetical protein
MKGVATDEALALYWNLENSQPRRVGTMRDRQRQAAALEKAASRPEIHPRVSAQRQPRAGCLS